MRGISGLTTYARRHRLKGPHVYEKIGFLQAFFSEKVANDDILVFTCRPDTDGDRVA